MIYILYTLFFTSCIALILSVLLQPGKTDAGALFTSNISSGALGPRGTQTILSKITIVAATVFMLSALFIAMPALQGGNSVLNANPDSPVTQPPITDLNANTNGANTNSAVETPVNANAVANANTAVVVPANTTANVAAVNATRPANTGANANK